MTPQVRQASGLAVTATSPGVLWTHNDRGIRDNPIAGEDVTSAAVWALRPTGQLLGKYRLLTTAGAGISFHDTEAITRDPAGRLVLADTGNNVDPQAVVHLYRFTAPVVSPTQAFLSTTVRADVIPVTFHRTATSTPRKVLNTEAVFMDTAGNAWFVPRKRTGAVAFYVATAAALEQARTSGVPARAVQTGTTGASGPFNDASLSPDGNLLLLKTTAAVHAYDLTGVRTIAGIAAAISRPTTSTGPCVVLAYPQNTSPGRGEAVVVANDGSFFTLAESPRDPAKTQADVYSFR